MKPFKCGVRTFPILCFTLLVLAAQTFAATIWAPMWDVRQFPMVWEVKASDNTINAHAFFPDAASATMQYDNGTRVFSGSGDRSTGPLPVTPGNIYRATMRGPGLHARPSP